MTNYIDVKRLEFMVTYECNSHCKHCMLGEEKRGLKPHSINSELATRIVKEVTRDYSPTSIMTFGGEPLLFPEVVCAIHHAAKEQGIGIREIITNAGYPRSETEFKKVAKRLAESGITHATVSVDSFHQEYIPVSTVEHNVQSLVDAGISVFWNPSWVGSMTDKNPWNDRTWAILDQLSYLPVLPVTESNGNTIEPKGNALNYLSEYLLPRIPNPEGRCEDVPYSSRLDQITSISVEPNGDISVCLEIFIGNANQNKVTDILQGYDPYKTAELEAILLGGLSGLTEFARSKGVEPDPEGYYSICHKCVDIRRKLLSVKSNKRHS